jgi:IclR family pca regulon transcriptional regulator
MPNHTNPQDPRFSQSLERGLAVLRCFSPEHPELGITDIASKLKLSKSTVHRYASTLVALGYLEQPSTSRKYRLGLNVADLGMTALNSTGLRDHARPFLEELRQTSGHTVSMAVLDGTNIRYIHRLRSFRSEQTRIDLDIHPGSTLPAYCTSMGKVLLANLPDDERNRRIDDMGNLIRHAQKTIASKSALHQELTQIRETGIAVNDEEYAPEIISIATPIRNDTDDVIAAINITAHTSLISRDHLVKTCGPQLTTTADLISARLGLRSNDKR